MHRLRDFLDLYEILRSNGYREQKMTEKTICQKLFTMTIGEFLQVF